MNILIKKYIYLILGISSLILGLMIYLLFRENTYISKFILSLVTFDKLKMYLNWLKCDFVCFYLPDYLWAFSLSCWLHIIFEPDKKGSIVCTIVVFAVGAIYEFLQYINIISGTGDFIDVFFYILAGITVNLIKGRMDKNEKKYSCSFSNVTDIGIWSNGYGKRKQQNNRTRSGKGRK